MIKDEIFLYFFISVTKQLFTRRDLSDIIIMRFEKGGGICKDKTYI